MPSRIELKQQAKASMKGRSPSVYIVTLVYLAIVWVVNLLSAKLQMGGISIDNIIAAAYYGDAYEIAMNYNPSFMAQLLSIALDIMLIILGMGFTIFALRVSRGLSAGFGELFDGFGMFFKLLWLSILMGIFVFLWSLLFVIPGIIASYRYSMAVYIMIDNPEFSALECISRSKEMMKGHKFEFFVLQLSFIGWAILSSIPFVSIYTMPYFETTYANYYNSLSGYIPQAEYNIIDDVEPED